MKDDAKEYDGDEGVIDPTHAAVGCIITFDGDVDNIKPVNSKEKKLEETCKDNVELLVGLLEDVGHGVESFEAPFWEWRRVEAVDED